jgi:hypothetical protein
MSTINLDTSGVSKTIGGNKKYYTKKRITNKRKERKNKKTLKRVV